MTGGPTATGSTNTPANVDAPPGGGDGGGGTVVGGTDGVGGGDGGVTGIQVSSGLPSSSTLNPPSGTYAPTPSGIPTLVAKPNSLFLILGIIGAILVALAAIYIVNSFLRVSDPNPRTS